MPYSIFSLDTGNMVDSFPTEDEAVNVARDLARSHPELEGSLGIVVSDDDGNVIGSIGAEQLSPATAA